MAGSPNPDETAYMGYGACDSRESAARALETSSLMEFHNIPNLNQDQKKRHQHATTDLQTFINLFKASFGTGFLALPLAFSRAGVIPGVIGLFSIGILATHCIILLLDVAATLYKRDGRSALNYAQVVKLCVEDFTGRKRLAVAFELCVNIFLVMSQLGFCAIYFVFIGENLSEVFCSAFGVHLDRRAWIAVVVVPVLVCTVFIRSFEHMVPFSIVSNVLLAYCILVILYQGVHAMITHNEVERADVLRGENRTVELFPHSQVYETLPLFFASAIYSFEIIGIVLPTENKMKNPGHAKRIFTITLVMAMCMYASFGLFGYLVYGKSIKGSISLNLVSTSVGTFTAFLLVRLFYSYVVFVSFMIQFYVPMDFVEPVLYNRILRLDHLTYRFPRCHMLIKMLAQSLFRVIVVLLIVTVSLTLPDLPDLITLIGALASSSLALIIPPLLEIFCFWKHRGKRKLLWVLPWPVWLGKDIFIICVGVAALVLGVYTSCLQIHKNFFIKPEQICDILVS